MNYSISADGKFATPTTPRRIATSSGNIVWHMPASLSPEAAENLARASETEHTGRKCAARCYSAGGTVREGGLAVARSQGESLVVDGKPVLVRLVSIEAFAEAVAGTSWTVEDVFGPMPSKPTVQDQVRAASQGATISA